MTKNDFSAMDLIDKLHKEYVAKMQEAAPTSDFNVLLQFQPVTKSIVSHGEENGGNVLGLEKIVEDGPTIMWLIALTVDTAENQVMILPLALQFRDAINAGAKTLGNYVDWEYLNYAYADQDPFPKFGPENVALLKAASEKYDPSAVFQKLRISGFKLP